VTTFERILATNGGDKISAAAEVAAGLMAGDPATFKAGYTLDNAVIAAAEVYELDDAAQTAVRMRLEALEAPG